MIAGQTLVKQGLLDDHQFAVLRDALAAGRPLGAGRRSSWASSTKTMRWPPWAKRWAWKRIDLAHTEIDRSLLEKFPIKLIHQHQVFPVAWKDDALVVATGDPYDLHALDAVSAATGWSVTPGARSGAPSWPS